MIHQTDSDALLERLSAYSGRKKRGKLRIYFGYAAGVGKTYTMLSDGHDEMMDGVDVVSGYIEPHMRPATLALMEGLETLPTLKLDYKGVQLNEFDLDGALKRKPELILVDELAHTNAEGCRHKKRYQDVEELLQAGIDVYTTINVQHIESLNDIVESITGIHVRERIPDSVFDSADQIELVDIEPNDLIDRLNKGKIYKEAQVQRALTNFFTKEKLIALREIALRRTADQVSRIAEQNEGRVKEGSYTNEHILVCLSSSASNGKIIRAASRMAKAFHGSFTALYVEPAGGRKEGEKGQEKYKNHLSENIRLAEQLGASIVTMYGDDIPAAIAECATTGRMSKVVIGRSLTKNRWIRPNYVDRLTELAPNIDVYVIPNNQGSGRVNTSKLVKPSNFSLGDTIKSLGILVACTLVGFIFNSLGFSVANIITVYILGALVNAILTKGRLYSAALSIISVIIFNYFFTEPYFSLKAYDPGYPMTFIVMLAASLITSTLTKRVKEQARLSTQKAYSTELLLETSRKLQLATGKEEILKATAEQVLKLLERPIIFYPAKGNKLGDPIIYDGKEYIEEENIYTCKEERAVAHWVYKNNKRAGATTNTLSAAKCLYLAVRGKEGVFAVVAVAMDDTIPLQPFEKNIMMGILAECGMALEKEQLDEKQKVATLKMEQEQQRSTLLRAISHDLRTPLTSISGNSGILIANSKVLDEERKHQLYTDIYDDSIWLINLVENLLSITRLEEGRLNMAMQPELVEEVIAEALTHIDREGANYNIQIDVEDGLLMAEMDSRLIMQVIINIVDNGIRYTPVGSDILISAKRQGEMVRVEIADNGPGIEDGEKDKIFDMFYTSGSVWGDGRRGLGLGLFLCKSIVEAHGGSIYVKNNIPKGTIFGFLLKVQEVTVSE